MVDTDLSPLGLVTREPNLHALVAYLAEMRGRIERDPSHTHTLVFSRTALDEARAAFSRMIRQGERRLHRLASCLCDTFFPARWEAESVVVGEVEATRARFVLSQTVNPEDLELYTDLDLGNRQLESLRFVDGPIVRRALLVANMVDYLPSSTAPHGIYKLLTRIKAEEELWNKVVDELFDLDAMVRRDKQLRRLSRYVKDVFGLKIVAGSSSRVRRIHEHLSSHAFDDAFLVEHGVDPSDATRRFELVETKDYLTDDAKKKSGWSAMKSVVRWHGTTFEIQVQPLRNYLRERERLTKESHAGFKSRREELRDRVAREVPLFGFYRDLLQWLFRSPGEAPPTFPGVEIELRP